MSPRANLILVAVIVLTVLRIYGSGKIGRAWSALNGSPSASQPPTGSQSTSGASVGGPTPSKAQ